nr:M67 family metallopeptidase [Altererythrobacter ishigakiensis]
MPCAMDIEVARQVVETIQREASLAYPHEACGMLLGEGSRIATALPTVNFHPNPEAHFEIDPQALIDAHRAARQGGPQVVGYYHSHPVGTAEPSQTDQAMASGDGRVWAILADGEIRFWQDNPSGFEALSHELVVD